MVPQTATMALTAQQASPPPVCPAVPRSALGKRIRMHHMLHHTRHEGYWLAFTVPEVRGDCGWRRCPRRPSARLWVLAMLC